LDNYVRNALLRWDRSYIPDNGTITGIALRFWCTNALSHNARTFGPLGPSTGVGTVRARPVRHAPTTPIFSVPIANITVGARNSVAFANLSSIGKTG
jgi:hypothetical protein